MQIQLIRSATLRFNYAEQQFMIDPYLAEKHSMPSYTGASPNPLVDLPCSPHQAIARIEMAIISHLHSDHFDPTAQRVLSTDITMLCQPEDTSEIEAKGFHHVLPVADTIKWKGITISRTTGQHGTGDVLNEMGHASGFVFQADHEPTVYWAGDTIWCDAVADVISDTQPDIIITHSCGAMWGDHVLIVMCAAQTIAVCRAASNSTVIATHMDTLDHATVSREALRKYAVKHGIQSKQLLIPADGEKLNF